MPKISFTAFFGCIISCNTLVKSTKKCQCFLVLLPSTILGGYNGYIHGDITKVSILSKLAALAVQLKELI